MKMQPQQFTPSTPALKEATAAYLKARTKKQQALEFNRSHSYAKYELAMQALRTEIISLVAHRLVHLDIIPQAAQHRVTVRYVTAPWGEWWEWCLTAQVPKPAQDKLAV